MFYFSFSFINHQSKIWLNRNAVWRNTVAATWCLRALHTIEGTDGVFEWIEICKVHFEGVERWNTVNLKAQLGLLHLSETAWDHSHCASRDPSRPPGNGWFPHPAFKRSLLPTEERTVAAAWGWKMTEENIKLKASSVEYSDGNSSLTNNLYKRVPWLKETE